MQISYLLILHLILMLSRHSPALQFIRHHLLKGLHWWSRLHLTSWINILLLLRLLLCNKCVNHLMLIPIIIVSRIKTKLLHEDFLSLFLLLLWRWGLQRHLNLIVVTLLLQLIFVLLQVLWYCVLDHDFVLLFHFLEFGIKSVSHIGHLRS